uniref:Transposase IS4-like domain-containing protein n=1 Tax=Aliivibrio wodanis TaxID=80852 RepID=A0A5Q4ZLX6_9GAMM|nr:hypothetical protein AW0309160_00209 [Aliivibrio wodanis]
MRTWRKLHLAVDVDTYEIIGAEVSLVNVGDNEVLPTLLNPLRRKIREISADSAYDTKECHKVLQRKGITPLIPRGKMQDIEGGHPRNDVVSALKANNLAQWKVDSEYHVRSLSETDLINNALKKPLLLILITLFFILITLNYYCH